MKDTGKKTSNMQGSLNISVPGTKASVGGALDESSVSTGVGAGFNVSPVNVDIPMSAGMDILSDYVLEPAVEGISAVFELVGDYMLDNHRRAMSGNVRWK